MDGDCIRAGETGKTGVLWASRQQGRVNAEAWRIGKHPKLYPPTTLRDLCGRPRRLRLPRDTVVGLVGGGVALFPPAPGNHRVYPAITPCSISKSRIQVRFVPSSSQPCSLYRSPHDSQLDRLYFSASRAGFIICGRGPWRANAECHGP